MPTVFIRIFIVSPDLKLNHEQRKLILHASIPNVIILDGIT